MVLRSARVASAAVPDFSGHFLNLLGVFVALRSLVNVFAILA
jgi:hypothetical protein